MLIIDKENSGNEDNYIHVCDNIGSLMRQRKYKNVEIRQHDCHTYLFDVDEDSLNEDFLDEICFCPYCGVIVDNEVRP